ncbi:5'-nucleotidase C-terminal domain-containing protein [Bacillus sp. SA1-12]|uniref:5'-nucleotidase C-terminal domain-containing protein n=1 Tax=Bacillus sp. SA1-12 TaxID=1455638 RepID=UPI000698D8F7|nr:5'-nucleotidase C-terminal domain-containing protein [Bacillus sp. SA1-12]
MGHKYARRILSLFLILSLVFPSILLNFTQKAKAQEVPLTVAEAIAKNNSGENATVEGYIIGHTVSSASIDFEAPFTNDFNFAIADSPNEKDGEKIMPVQLPSSFRSTFGLAANPGIIGKKVRIAGSLNEYFVKPGIKSPTAIEFTEGTGPVDPDPVIPGDPISIADARTKLGQEVTVVGTVTADNSAIGGGRLSTFIQDETAGINLFSISAAGFPDLKEGQQIKVTGTITSYRGLTEIEPNTDGIEVLSENNQLPAPAEMSLLDLSNAELAEPKEGQLVKASGFVQSVPSSPAGGGYNVTVIDEAFNSTTIRIMEATNAISAVEAGKWYEFTGVLSQYDSFQVMPRKTNDIKLLDPQPEAPQSAGEYISTVASVVDGDTIHLKTPVLGSTKVRYVNIDTPETYHTPQNEADQNQLDHGNKAKAYLNELLKPGDEVIVKLGNKATDDYGRLLAQVIRKHDGLNTNLEMVKKGYASTYFIWPVGDEADYNKFQAAVKEAKDAGLGIWNPANPLMELPFAFRARDEGKGFTRFVGNSETKTYVTPEEWEEVPVEKRIFFASVKEAEDNGYTAAGIIETDTISVQLLGVNDLHGKVDVTGTVNGVNYGRMDYLAAYLREREAANPNTLIVHAGDMVGGSSPVSALLQDEPTVEMMESIGFDVGTVGNHEFDEGVDEMLRLINGGDHANGTPNYDGIDFPMVAANVEYKNSGNLVLDPYAIKEVNGAKIGFIGVATTETPNMIIAKGNEHIRFTDEAEAINKYVPELQEQGVEAIVILAHVPGNQSGDSASGDIASIATKINDAVDVIFAAHNHVKLNAVVDNKLIVQAWEYGKAFSDVDLQIDRISGDIVKKSAEIVDVIQTETEPDQEVKTILDQYLDAVGPKLNEVVGEAGSEMTGGYTQKGLIGDNALGNLIADGMAAAMDSDFALMNGGGIRDDLNAGDITWNELFNIQPFGNTLVKLEISGADLRAILNSQFSSYGPDVSISGFSYTWDHTKGTYGEVIDIYLPDGSKIDPGDTYTVTVNNYMYPHSSDKYLLGELGVNTVQGPEDLQATVDFVKGFDHEIFYTAEGRISEDFTAPVTNHTLSQPDKTNGEYSKEVKVTLSATDAGVGVNYIEYKLNDGEWLKYEQPLTIANEGEYTLSYRAKDKVHNVEELKTVPFTIKQSSIKDIVNLILEKDLNNGLKRSYKNHLERAEGTLPVNPKQAISILNDVKKKIEQLPSKQVTDQDKQEITKLIEEIISGIKVN